MVPKFFTKNDKKFYLLYNQLNSKLKTKTFKNSVYRKCINCISQFLKLKKNIRINKDFTQHRKSVDIEYSTLKYFSEIQ